MTGRRAWRVNHSQPDLKGQVALVTGGNSGLGFQVALGLAHREHVCCFP